MYVLATLFTVANREPPMIQHLRSLHVHSARITSKCWYQKNLWGYTTELADLVLGYPIRPQNRKVFHQAFTQQKLMSIENVVLISQYL